MTLASPGGDESMGLVGGGDFENRVHHAAGALQRAAEQLVRLPTRGSEGMLYHQTLAALHSLLGCAAAAAEAGVPYADLRAVTAGAREFHGRYSRTLAHTQRWPRGYPGDVELVERLLDADPGGEARTLDRALETCVLQLPIAQPRRDVASDVAAQIESIDRARRLPADLAGRRFK